MPENTQPLSEKNNLPSTSLPFNEQGGHLLDYVNVVLRRWKIALLVFVLVFCGVAIKTYLTKPVYEAHATLAVGKKQQGNVLKDIGMEAGNDLAADLQLLRSRAMAEKVVQRLNLHWQATEIPAHLSYRIDQLTLDSTLSSVIVELTGDKNYRLIDSHGRVLAEGVSGHVFKGAAAHILLHLQGGQIGDRLVLERFPASAMVGSVTGVHASEQGRGTNVIRLSYRDTDPLRARDLANAFAQVYREQSILSKSQKAGKAVEFIDQQLAGLKSSLDQTEQELQEYKVESGLTTLGSEGSSLVEKLVKLEERKASLEFKRKRLEVAVSEVRQAIASDTNYTPTVVDGVADTASLASTLAELEAEKKFLLADFTQAHPAVVSIQQQIRKALERLLSAYQSGLKAIALERKDLGETLAGYEKQLQHIPEAELELAKRSRVNKVNAQLYTFLLQKQQETRIAQASTLSSVEIIDPAYTPTVPIKPNKQKNLLLGLILGLMAGVGLTFLLDYLNDTINNAEEIKNHLGVAVLGNIPKIAVAGDTDSPGEGLICQLAPKSPPVEAFRALRTALHFASANKNRKVLMVTSSFLGEGKSTISANLSLVLAQTDSRVLLVGCDLRRPSLFQKFGTPKEPGLADLLVDQVRGCVHRVAGTSLDVIDAGTVPANPSELLGSERMAAFLTRVRERYDYIVIDAPPVLPVTDAQVLTSLVDEVLIVFEACRVPRKAALRTMETPQAGRDSIVGAVLNDKTGNGSKGYGYYGYYGHKSYGGYYGESSGSFETGGFFARMKKLLG